MKKYLILFLLFLIQIECIAQYSRVYESYRKNINRIAEGIGTDIIEDEQGKAYFGSVAWSLDPKQTFNYTFVSKLDRLGNVEWAKPISDTVQEPSIPRLMAQLRDGRYIVGGSIVQDSFTSNQNWLAFFDGDFNKLDEKIYPVEYDANDLWSFHQHSDGDLIFCGLSGKYYNQPGGGLGWGRAFILCTDSLGEKKWYREFYDTSRPRDLHWFSHVTEDHLGNIYVCGFNSKAAVTGNRLVVKLNKEGTVLWYKEIASPGFANRFMYVQERPDHNMILIGSLFDLQLRSDSVLISIMDPLGNVLSEFTVPKNYYTAAYWRCKPTIDGNIICAGGLQRNEDPNGNDFRNGFAHKLNMDGKILWEQEYSAVDSLVELFFNLGLSRDGGFYFGGISWLPEIYESRNWLVRVDSNGCLIPGCNPVGITEKESYPEHYVLAPNPAQEEIYVYSNEYHYKASEISIFNEWGTQVYSSRIETAYKQKINLSQFSAGIYYYVIHRANQKLQSGRFVKI